MDLDKVEDLRNPSRWQICPHTDCSWHRGPAFEHLGHLGIEETGPFRSLSKYTEHMRTAHDESPYPCAVLYCSKIGGRGYFRALDLKKHYEKVHPGVSKSIFAATMRTEIRPCLVPNCSRNGEVDYRSFYELEEHYMTTHGYDEIKSRRLAGFSTSYTIKKTSVGVHAGG